MPDVIRAAEDPSERWSGLLLSIGILALLVSIFLYTFVLGTPEGSGPDGEITNQDFARHITTYEALTRSIWFNEMVSSLLIAIAAFTLRGCTAHRKTAWPIALLWTAVGVGATIQVAGYGLTIGSYWHAAAVVETDPALFDSLRGASSMIFGMGTLGVMGGLALVVLGEARSSAPVIYAPIGYIGGFVGIIGLGYPISFITGVDAFLITAPLAFLFFPIVVYLGGMIWWRGRSPTGFDVAAVRGN